MKKIAVINGPNLNFLGIREKGIYGSENLDEINGAVAEKCRLLQIEPEFFQSNCEGQIIDFIQRFYINNLDIKDSLGIIINPGAFTHYSYAIRDAITSVSIPALEVHISNVHAREEFRSRSVIAPVCLGQICGLGLYSYLLAVEYFK